MRTRVTKCDCMSPIQEAIVGSGETTPAQRLSEIIERNQQEIERRWLERVQRDVARMPGVELTHLRNGLPDYLTALGASRYRRASPSCSGPAVRLEP